LITPEFPKKKKIGVPHLFWIQGNTFEMGRSVATLFASHAISGSAKKSQCDNLHFLT
jgi:hypothetical protein